MALRLSACFDAGKCKWLAVRCNLLNKAKEDCLGAKALGTRVYEMLVFLRNKDRVDGRYARGGSLTGIVVS